MLFVLHCTILYFTILLYCTVLYCTVLYCASPAHQHLISPTLQYLPPGAVLPAAEASAHLGPLVGCLAAAHLVQDIFS